jgi:hypothetical protein
LNPSLLDEKYEVGSLEKAKSPRENNRTRTEDRAAHEWYRFVLSFPPHLVRDYVTKFALDESSCVLDPFCGTGTTVVECKRLGIPSVGTERNPMAWFASKTKTNWSVSPDALWHHARRVAEVVNDRLESQGLGGVSGPLFPTQGIEAPLRTLTHEAEKLLLKGSICPKPLHQALTIKEALSELEIGELAAHEQLALARTVVSDISNLQFGPEVGVKAPRIDAPAVSSWLDRVRTIVEDLRVLKPMEHTRVNVYQADARDLSAVIQPESIDAVITSPPYPNEKDYTRTTRLESVILGFLKSKEDLRRLKYGLVRSNTRSVYKSDSDHLYVAGNAEVQRIAAAIETRRIELGKTSGFERLYPRLTQLYFGGMYRHLADLRKFLRPNAQLAYVVGDQASYLRVMIRTGQILAQIAESLGYEVTGIDLFRTRLATATREQLREEVVLLRWNPK